MNQTISTIRFLSLLFAIALNSLSLNAQSTDCIEGQPVDAEGRSYRCSLTSPGSDADPSGVLLHAGHTLKWICDGWRDRYRACEERKDKKASLCSSAMQRLTQSKRDAMKACQDAKIASFNDCLEDLNQCEESEEDPGIMFPSLGLGTGASTCSDYSTSEYKSALSDAKRSVSDAKKDLNDEQKEAAKDREDLREAQRKIFESYNDLMKEYKEIKNEQEKSYEEQKAQIRELESKAASEVSKIESDIANAKVEMKQVIAKRSMDLEDFKISLRSCPDNARTEVENLPQFKPKPKSNMTMSQINARSQDKKGRYQDALVSCRTKLIKRKDIGAQAVKDTLDAYERRISDLEQKKQSLQVEIAELKRQKAQAELKKLELAKDAEEQKNTNLGLKQKEALDLQQSASEKQANSNQRMQQISLELRQAEAELQDLEASNPRTKKSREKITSMVADTTEYKEELKNCARDCGKSCADITEFCRANPGGVGCDGNKPARERATPASGSAGTN